MEQSPRAKTEDLFLDPIADDGLEYRKLTHRQRRDSYDRFLGPIKIETLQQFEKKDFKSLKKSNRKAPPLPIRKIGKAHGSPKHFVTRYAFHPIALPS